LRLHLVTVSLTASYTAPRGRICPTPPDTTDGASQGVASAEGVEVRHAAPRIRTHLQKATYEEVRGARQPAPRIATRPLLPAPSDGVRQTVISTENQEAISKFLKTSVQPSTDRKYELQWGWFVEFMREQGSEDPFMRELTQQEKAAMISLFMISRYMEGKRGKAASAATAAIRLRFSQEILDTAFLDSAMVSTARSACLLNPEELRLRRNSAPASTVKLPVCEEIITSMRERLVANRTWTDPDMKLNMLYCGVMFGDRVVLTGRSVRDEVKNTCASFGLNKDYFSAHSLRKAAITHMRSQGTSVDDRLDRGN
jgi:hypothetical protein